MMLIMVVEFYWLVIQQVDTKAMHPEVSAAVLDTHSIIFGSFYGLAKILLWELII